MAVFNLISSLALAKITILIHFRVPIILLLTCLQEVQVSALPTGNATEFFSTHNSTNGLATSTRNSIYTIQYPPTTTVQKTTPGTKGVSGCLGTNGFTHGPRTDGIVNVN